MSDALHLLNCAKERPLMQLTTVLRLLLAGLFSLILSDVSSQSGQCITQAGPVETAWMNASRSTFSAFRDVAADNNSLIYVPIKHHVVLQDDGTGGVDPIQLDALLDTLNTHFAASNIHFFSCGLPEEIYSDTWSQLRTDEEGDMCDQHDVPNVLNIYYVDEIMHGTISLCGYTYYPGGQDRMILDVACALNSNTMIHEMGHYFSLPHTHGSQPPGALSDELVDRSNCETAGDGFCDTPADPGLSYFTVNTSCEYTGTAVDANGDSFQPSVRNYMSYSRIDCRNSFTPQQAVEMAFSAIYDRPYLNCDCQAPSGLSVTPSNTSATVSWNAVPGATGYQLSGRRTGTTQFRSVYVNGTSKNVGGLVPSNLYEWQVRAQCVDGTITDYSQLDTFATTHQRESQLQMIDTELDVQIWPNPAKQDFSASWEARRSGLVRVTLRDGAGTVRWQTLKSVESGHNQVLLSRRGVEPGMYFLHLASGSGHKVVKVMFEGRP